MYSARLSFNDALAVAHEKFATLNLNALRKAGIYHKLLEYYLIGTYPPLKAMTPISAESVFVNATGNYNLYFHIPFCEQYCTFCHFTKQINPKEDRVKKYVNALCKEMDLVYRMLDGDIKAHTIYFGGGTPSYLRPTPLRQILGKLLDTVKILEDAEITFELHPGIINHRDFAERINILKGFGVNRWVFGVQSMNGKILKKLNRGHTRQDVYNLLKLLRQNNCNNISLDLIYGLPYQNLKTWYQTLTLLIDAGVEKFNIFPLMFKAADPISLQYKKEPHIFPTDKQRLLMYYMMEYLLKQEGFRRGPIFYYSKDKTHSRQQVSKFEDIEEINLLPFGVSGFGYIGNTQYFNTCKIDDYMKKIEANKIPVWMGYDLSKQERLRRNIMFSLKSNGISRSELKKKYNIDILTEFSEEFEILKNLELINVQGEHIQLTDLGALNADGVASIFASKEVVKKIRKTNKTIVNPRKDLLEIHDFSLLDRRSLID